MPNAPTGFSGPVIYSGRGINNGFFENLPIGVNPDYVVFMDDFITEAIDTDKWDTETLNSGTVGLLGGAATGDDIPYGWAQAKGSGTTADSGAGLRLNETIQGTRKTTNWFEASVGLGDSALSNLFVGFSGNDAMATGQPFAAGQRIGIQVESGSAEIKCISRNWDDEEITSTGIDFEDYSMASGAGVGGKLGDTRKLGFRWTNPSQGDATWHSYRVDFFVDRVLVATHQNTATYQPIATKIFMPWWAFTQGAVAAEADCVLDYMLVVSSRGEPENGKMVAFGSRS